MGATAAAAVEVFTSSEAVAATAAAATGAVVDSALAPDAPQAEKPLPMPDPLETQKAKERSLVEQMARRGRSASILTNAGGGTLGS